MDEDYLGIIGREERCEKLQSTENHTLDAQNSARDLVTDLLKAYGLRLEGKPTKWDVLLRLST